MLLLENKSEDEFSQNCFFRNCCLPLETSCSCALEALHIPKDFPKQSAQLSLFSKSFAAHNRSSQARVTSQKSLAPSQHQIDSGIRMLVWFSSELTGALRANGTFSLQNLKLKMDNLLWGLTKSKFFHCHLYSISYAFISANHIFKERGRFVLIYPLIYPHHPLSSSWMTNYLVQERHWRAIPFHNRGPKGHDRLRQVGKILISIYLSIWYVQWNFI